VVNEPRLRLAALLLCLGCFTRAGSAGAQEHGSRVRPTGEALIVGSSSVRQAFGRILVRSLERRGYRVQLEGVTSAGLARPDFRDIHSIMDNLPVHRATAIVLLYLGTNDAQSLWLHPHERSASGRAWLAWGDPSWSRVYERRARRLFDRLCERGAGRVVAILPVDVEPARLQRRLQRIRKLQARAAVASKCAEAISTSGDWGRFEVGGKALRRRDGFHMTPQGARAVWNRIRRGALPLAAEPTGRQRLRAKVERMLGGAPAL
jgi:hypothetical protein